MKEKRLRDRNTETADSLQKRLNTAKAELEYGLYSHGALVGCLRNVCWPD